MTTPGNVQAVNINDLKRYAPDARVNQPLLSSRNLVTRMNCYEPGQITPLHMHPEHHEVVFCVEGRGAVTFEERDALMRKMIAAKPDRANPFKSPIQRYHRAKLIMQSLGRDFGDADPWIDLSQYPQNWPELARRSQAA